jgi:hypothetical protein
MSLPPPEIRLIGPPQADGEYVGLRERGSDEEFVHLNDYERLYEVPGSMSTSSRRCSAAVHRRSRPKGSCSR